MHRWERKLYPRGSRFIDTSSSYLPEGWQKSGRAGLASPAGLRFLSKARAIQHLAQAGDWPAVQLVRDLCVTSEG